MADIGEKVSGFFKNIGGKINDATYDMRAESDFNKNHPSYTVYTSASSISGGWSAHAEEHLDEDCIIALGTNDNVKPGHVIVKGATTEDPKPQPRYVAAVEKTTITFEFEGKSNEKPALAIALGEPAEKVEVIKVGDSFYLKKSL